MKNTVLAGMAMAAIFACAAISGGSMESETFTVRDKERINTDAGGYYLVFTDKGAYKNEDSYIQFKFNSSDLHSNLEIGHEYTCTTNWFRVPFLSMYRNILSCN